MHHDTWYMLAQVVLHSACHFCAISVNNNQYVLYDGMLRKMRDIDGYESFQQDGDYVISSLWYQKIDTKF